jgi:hypothetical protein
MAFENRYPDILPKDTLSKDILPKDILPNGHFADGVLPNGHFAERTFCRTDSLSKGQLAENRDGAADDSFVRNVF